MRYFTLVVIFIFSLPVFLVSQDYPWNAYFGNEGAEFAYDIKQTNDDGYIIAAYGSNGGTSDFYIVKLDSFGSLEWENIISKDNYSERAFSILNTNDENYLVIGNATNFNKPWLVKLDTAGDTLWTSQWTDNVANNTGLLARGAQLPDGRIVVVSHEDAYALDPYMFIVSEDGELLEERDLESLIPLGWFTGTTINDIESTEDGGFILTGGTGGGTGSRAYLWKFDSNADSSWSVIFDDQGTWMRYAQSVKQIADGGYILTGSTAPNTTATAALRADASGNLIWYQSYPDSMYTNGTDIIEWKSGEFLITEKRFSGFGTSFFSSALLRIDSLGNMLARDMIMASDSSTTITQMRRTNDGGYVIAGEINEYLSIGEQDLFVLKSDSLGNIDNVFIDYVWPGDVDYNGIVDMNDLMILGVTAGSQGQARVDTSLGWYPHYVTDWADTVVTGVNFKHADTDGNGIVETIDTLAISLNYGLTHVIPAKSEEMISTGPSLYLDPDEVFIESAFTIAIPLYAGTDQEPLESLYGLKFNVHFDSELFQANGSGFHTTPDSWISGAGENILDLTYYDSESGYFEYGYTRIDHEEISGSGKIGILYLKINENLGPWDELSFEITFTNAAFNSHGLEITALETSSYVISISNTFTNISDPEEREIKLFPNPAEQSWITISGNRNIDELLLYSMNGSVQRLEVSQNRRIQLPEVIKPGIYFVTIVLETGEKMNEKLIIH